MNPFQTHMQDAAPALFEQLGETVTYTPAGGDARAITAIVERGQGPQTNPGKTQIRIEEVLVQAYRLATTGIDDPRQGDSIRLDDDAIDATTLWDFAAIEFSDGVLITSRWKKGVINRKGANKPSTL